MASNAGDTAPSASRAPQIIIGFLLLLPAALACLLTFLLPSIQLGVLSLQEASLFGSPQFIGMENYARFGNLIGSGDTLLMTGLILVERLLAVALVPPLLALGIARSAPALRLGARLLLTVPLALYAPLITLMAWYFFLSPEPGETRVMLLLSDGLMTLALASAATLPAYLASLSNGQGPGSRPFAIIWGISVLAVIALSLQTFALSYLVRGGPGRSTESLIGLMFRLGFMNMELGAAASIAMLVLLPVLLIGLVAGLLVATSDLVIQWRRDTDTGTHSTSSAPMLVGVAMLIVAALGCVLSILPYGAQIGTAGPPSAGPEMNMGSALLNTLVPPALGVLLIQLPLTWLAALGIGALRPIGHRSELLLLPFSPWLFVTVGPLLIAFFNGLRAAEIFNTFFALLPRFAISIPMLFILTLFFKGQELKRQTERAPGQSTAQSVIQYLILPSLPLALLLGLAALLVQMQSILWPLVAAQSPDRYTLPLWLVMIMSQFGLRSLQLGTLLLQSELPIFIVFLLIYAIFQWRYLPQLLITQPQSPIPVGEATAEDRTLPL